MDPKDQHELDNRSNQLNPNNAEYHNSRSNNDDYDDDDDVKGNSAESDDYFDNDSDDFDEEWIPQDAW